MTPSQRIEYKWQAKLLRASFNKRFNSKAFRNMIGENPAPIYVGQNSSNPFDSWEDERIIKMFLELAKPLNIDAQQMLCGLDQIITGNCKRKDMEEFDKLVYSELYRLYIAGKELHGLEMVDRFDLK